MKVLTIPHRQLAPIRHRNSQILAQSRVDISQQRFLLEYRLGEVGDARARVALAGCRDEGGVAGGEEVEPGEGDCEMSAGRKNLVREEEGRAGQRVAD